jgi:hypothetical protein
MFTLPASGQTPATQSTSSGTITGRVVSDTGQPLANARVMLRTANSVQQLTGMLTDRDGKFQITDLEPRPYQLSVYLSAYTPFTSPTNYRAGDSVTVVLTKGGVITGTVTTQTGEPVVGVRVRVRMIGVDSRPASLYDVYALERMTDDRGVYRIYGLRTGTYVVWAGGGGGPGQSGLDPFDDIVPTYSPSSTRDDAAEISVRAGEEVSNVDIRFRGEPGHTISGKASLSNNAPPSYFTLNLTPAGKNKFEWSTLTVQGPDSQSFAFRGVDDGDYDLTVLSHVADGLGNGVATKRIKVNGADVTGIELVTEPLASVSGRIALEESNKTECTGKQRPVFSETVVLASQDESQPSDYPFQFMLKAPASIEANGKLSLKNLLPGRYVFVPEFAAKYWYLQSITLPPAKAARTPAPVDATRSWTTLKSGDRLSGLTITLAQGAASLSAQIADNHADSLFLYLVPADKEQAEDVLRFFSAAIGADGKVELHNLPPGRYWALVHANTESAGATTGKLRLPDQKELRTTLRREAEAAKTAIELKPCQHLTGLSLKSEKRGDTERSVTPPR